RNSVTAYLAIQRIRDGALLEADARTRVLIRASLSAIRQVLTAAATNETVELLGVERPLLELARSRVLAVILPISLYVLKRQVCVRVSSREAPGATTRCTDLPAALPTRTLDSTGDLAVGAVGPPGGDTA